MADPDNDVSAKQDVPSRRTRRAFLTAGAAAAAVAAVEAVVRPQDAEAASIVLGGTNSTTKPTIVRNTRAVGNAKALVGRTTYTGPAINAAGVQGIADGTNASGVAGVANKGINAAGVYGFSATGSGVLGIGPDGVVGLSGATDGSAVLGIASEDCLDGVAGLSDALDGNGLYGEANNGVDAAGIYATSDTGWAAWFDGDVFMTGAIYSPAAFLQVDHPVDPENRWYRQAIVGSYEQISVLSGNVRTNGKGRAVVRIPRLFEQTHRDIRYQLTAIGKPALVHIAAELADGRFVIAADGNGVQVSWQLTGLRTDLSSSSRRFEVDPPKTGRSRGRYLEPRAFGVAGSRGLRRRGGEHRMASRRRPEDDAGE